MMIVDMCWMYGEHGYRCIKANAEVDGDEYSTYNNRSMWMKNMQ